MRYKQFGKTGMQVSEMALGTWGIGGVGWDTHSEESRLDAIRAAVEAGVTFFDTAPAYNAGVAEQVLGKALADLGARKNVIISTKCGNEYINGGYVKDGDPKRFCGVRGVPAQPAYGLYRPVSGALARSQYAV